MVKPRLRRRVIATSVAIIVVVTTALAAMINKLYTQSYMTNYSSELVAQIPMVVAQLKEAGVVNDLNSWINTIDSSNTDYLSVLCDRNDVTAWRSEKAIAAGVKDICQFMPAHIPIPTLITSPDGKSYIAYNLAEPSESAPNALQVTVLRSADDYISSLNSLHHRTVVYLGLFVLVAIGLLVAAFHWSFQPLRRLTLELNEISESKREQLGNGYPTELVDTTKALNLLIHQSSDKKQRYRHAMDDLAHSLKTRLAATNAILDDPDLTRPELNFRIVEQISQMDELVQYQLKRAMMGQQGLSHDKTELKPIVDTLSRMMSKVYSDKDIRFIQEFDHQQTVPIHKDDLMELLGNLLENAARFSIETVKVSFETTDKHYILRIEDDGPGVTPKLRDAIFNRGVRADQRHPGTGIGLAVCHEIVTSYRGNIQVTDSTLQGASFIITLPITH